MKRLIYMMSTVGVLCTGLHLQGADEQLQASQAEEVQQQHLTETEGVTRAFQYLLSRMPNEGEISHYSGRVRIGGVEGMRSDLIADRRAEIVISTFQEFLSRKPTDKEITHYSSRIQPLPTTEGVAAMRSDVLADKRAERDSAASEEAATTCTQSIAEEATSTVAPAEATAVRAAPGLGLEGLLYATGVKTREKTPELLEYDPMQQDDFETRGKAKQNRDLPSVYVGTHRTGTQNFFSFSRSHRDLSWFETYSHLKISSRARLINEIAMAAFNGMALAKEITGQDLFVINNYTEFSPNAEVPVVIGIVSSQPFETEEGLKQLVAQVILHCEHVNNRYGEYWMEECFFKTLETPTHNVRFAVLNVSVSAVDAANAPAIIKDMKKPLIDMQAEQWEKISFTLEDEMKMLPFQTTSNYQRILRGKLMRLMPKEMYQYYSQKGYDKFLQEILITKMEGISRLRGTVDLPAL